MSLIRYGFERRIVIVNGGSDPYIARPAIANERIKRNHAGQVVLQLKSAYKGGTTHIVMSPLELMQRLAALVPRPRSPQKNTRKTAIFANHSCDRLRLTHSPAQR
jgi:hypothetical protein